MPKKADSLADVIRLFDPREPLRDEKLEAFYIHRPHDPLETMTSFINLMHPIKPVKLLFTGHSGSGKSTELNKLATRLGQDFFIVNLDVRESLNIFDLSYVDVLLGLLTALFRQATDEAILAKAPAQIAGDVWQDVSLFIQHKLFGAVPFTAPKPAEVGVALGVKSLAMEFEAKFSREATTRDAVRKQVEPIVSEVIDELDFISRQVRDHYQRPVLFFIEGTDKTDLQVARDLFFNRTQSLTAFQAAAIYTFPIALHYSPDLILIRERFDDIFFLPNLKVRQRDDTDDLDGLTYLRQIVTVRANETLFDTAALELLLRASGGLVRTLIRLVRDAALHALTHKRPNQVTLEDAQAAINEEKADYIAALRSDDYPVLAERMADHRLTGDPQVQELLHSRALLEYANGEPWCDVHPVIRELVKERVRS